MEKEQVIATWVFLMLNAVRRRLDLAWEQYDAIVGKYRLLPFLFEQYELLHYYDNDYIIEDVFRYIREQGGDPYALRRTV